MIVVTIDKDSAKQACYLLSYQILLGTLFTIIVLESLYLLVQVAQTEDAFLVFVTFIITWGIEQIKQFGMLAIIYIVVVRRFGFLKQNEKTFVNPEDREIKTENAIPRLKSCCLKALEDQYIERLSLLTIGLYSVFILFDLTMS